MGEHVENSNLFKGGIVVLLALVHSFGIIGMNHSNLTIWFNLVRFFSKTKLCPSLEMIVYGNFGIIGMIVYLILKSQTTLS
jgi:hypothetical protein